MVFAFAGLSTMTSLRPVGFDSGTVLLLSGAHHTHTFPPRAGAALGASSWRTGPRLRGNDHTGDARGGPHGGHDPLDIARHEGHPVGRDDFACGLAGEAGMDAEGGVGGGERPG